MFVKKTPCRLHLCRLFNSFVSAALTLRTFIWAIYTSRRQKLARGKLNPDDGYFDQRRVPARNPTSFLRKHLPCYQRLRTKSKPLTSVNFKLRYFNTSSSKAILKVLIMFADLHKRLTRVKVNWYYDADDEDMHDTAKDPRKHIGPWV